MKKLAAGSFLAIVFFGVFIAILMILSTLELQSEVLTLQDGKSVHATLGSIRNDIPFLAAAAEHKKQQSADLQKFQQQLTDSRAEQGKAQANLALDVSRLKQAVNKFASEHGELFEMIPPLQFRTDLTAIDDDISAYLAKGRGQLPSLSPQFAAFGKTIAEFRVSIRPDMSKYDEHGQQLMSAMQNEKIIQQRLDQLSKSSSLDALPDSLKDSNYKSVVEDFAQNEWLFGSLAFIPRTMLVLFLALSMGMLGSLILLAQELIKADKTTGVGEMAFRIGLGAAIALALFCFAAAGVLALSASGQDKANMSPYLISFLGITAGYLSDRVTTWMRQVGERTFTIDPEAPPSP